MEESVCLRKVILELSSSDDIASLNSAADLCSQLPPPEVDPGGLAMDCFYQAAWSFDRNGRHAAAEDLYRRALCYPGIPKWTSANIHYRVAICMQLQAKNDPEIAGHFRVAIQESDASVPVGQLARYSLGCLLLSGGDYAGADEQFSLLGQETELSIPAACLRANHLLCVLRLGGGTCAERARALFQERPAVPAGDPALIQTLFEAAVAAEGQALYDVADSVYRTVLECPDLSGSLRANARFRLGLVSDFQYHWQDSFDHYRAAIALGDAAQCPEVSDLSRFHLAHLLVSAEEHEEAAALFEELASRSPMGRTPNVRLQYAGCLYRCGAVAAAEGVLTLIEGADSSLQAKIDHLLAEIYENLKNYRAAISYYQRVAINPSVELVTKWAALERLNSIRKMA